MSSLTENYLVVGMDAQTPLPFGRRLAELRKEAGITLNELSHRAWAAGHSISEPSLRNYEKGRTRGLLKRESYEAVAKALEVDPNEFVEYRLVVLREMLDPMAVGLEVAAATLALIEGASPAGVVPPPPESLQPRKESPRTSARGRKRSLNH